MNQKKNEYLSSSTEFLTRQIAAHREASRSSTYQLMPHMMALSIQQRARVMIAAIQAELASREVTS